MVVALAGWEHEAGQGQPRRRLPLHGGHAKTSRIEADDKMIAAPFLMPFYLCQSTEGITRNSAWGAFRESTANDRNPGEEARESTEGPADTTRAEPPDPAHR